VLFRSPLNIYLKVNDLLIMSLKILLKTFGYTDFYFVKLIVIMLMPFILYNFATIVFFLVSFSQKIVLLCDVYFLKLFFELYLIFFFVNFSVYFVSTNAFVFMTRRSWVYCIFFFVIFFLLFGSVFYGLVIVK